jgi:hypothetical protein
MFNYLTGFLNSDIKDTKHFRFKDFRYILLNLNFFMIFSFFSSLVSVIVDILGMEFVWLIFFRLFLGYLIKKGLKNYAWDYFKAFLIKKKKMVAFFSRAGIFFSLYF